ncbi:MAG TPA: segregation/condensation protein A [Candidatus Deferrimicrobiaceae bacterium]
MTEGQDRPGAGSPGEEGRGGEGTSPGIRVSLDIFEGPLDLLLHLVRENRLDIQDIPIAKITEQYLAYLDLMQALNLDVAGEFLVMASTLLYIKSRSLLPRQDEEAGEGEDPETLRAELSRRLVEYEKIKEAAARLGERPLLGRDVFARDFLGEEIPEGEVLLTELSLADLITAFKDVLERMPKGDSVDVYVDRLPIADAIAFLLDRLREEGSIRFDRLVEEFQTRNELISFFLGILELVRMRTVKVYQAVSMGLITIVPAVREEDDGRGHEGSGTG